MIQTHSSPEFFGQRHLVRVGRLGQIGSFAAVDQTCYPRRSRVIVRSERGLELGEVLSGPGSVAVEQTGASGLLLGSILRGATEADELLALRLERNRQAALEACTTRLAQLDRPVALVDVEHSFDGRTLRFYFLGETDEAVESLVGELAELYEAEVQIRAFTETLTNGCGPGCGTDEATGGGCTSCGTGCAVASACGSRRAG
jgi:cell fate regulator YaaT (PSP1 superfamily)